MTIRISGLKPPKWWKVFGELLVVRLGGLAGSVGELSSHTFDASPAWAHVSVYELVGTGILTYLVEHLFLEAGISRA